MIGKLKKNKRLQFEQKQSFGLLLRSYPTKLNR